MLEVGPVGGAVLVLSRAQDLATQPLPRSWGLASGPTPPRVHTCPGPASVASWGSGRGGVRGPHCVQRAGQGRPAPHVGRPCSLPAVLSMRLILTKHLALATHSSQPLSSYHASPSGECFSIKAQGPVLGSQKPTGFPMAQKPQRLLESRVARAQVWPEPGLPGSDPLAKAEAPVNSRPASQSNSLG